MLSLLSTDIPAISGIYRIICTKNNKSYIGQAKNIKLRIKYHLASTINPQAKDYSVPIHCAIRKYGLDSFKVDILETCNSESLNNREIYWIKVYNTYIHETNSMGYNATRGGKQYIRQVKLTEEDVFQIYKLLQENILTYSEIALKYNLNKDTIKKINYGKLWFNPALVYPISNNSTCKNKLVFGNCRYTGFAVEQLDSKTLNIINIFPSTYIAAKSLGNISYHKHIAHCCAGQRKSAYGYAWKYIEISESDWKNLFTSIV